MKYQIVGSVMQALEVHLTQGESIYTESGGMAWMMGPVRMETSSRGGVLKGLGRMLAGESFFMTTYTCEGPECMVVFTPEAPGAILALELQPGQSIIAQKDAFMCAETSVQMEMHFRKRLGAGLFGGEGFILQRLTGPGTVFLEIPGEVRGYNLGPNHVLKVDPGHIAAFDPTVTYDITRLKGLKNILFSGESFFLATLKGPGRVWLQTLPLPNFALKLARYMPFKRKDE